MSEHDELRLLVPTYYRHANSDEREAKEVGSSDFGLPIVPVLVHPADGLRIVLGSHDINDLSKPDIQIERRRNGWAVFLQPIPRGDTAGYVYFLDDERSFLVRDEINANQNVRVVKYGRSVPELDDPDWTPGHSSAHHDEA